MQNTTDKPKWIGYSKEVAYPLLRLGKSENTGWCIIEGWSTPVCCLFEKIIVNGKIQKKAN
jgi:hypothetical protein